MRIGTVPYLNAKPLIDWFHSEQCDADAKIVQAVPSELALMLDRGDVDVALVSVFDLFVHSRLRLIPGISISADGPVKSVRLFSKVPLAQIRSVALDTSSLTSTALLRILLAERHGISPRWHPHAPDLDAMLASHDAALLIGDLRLFQEAAAHVTDLGAEWKALTGLPFVYAAWLARPEAPLGSLEQVLHRAKEWGVARLESLSETWAARMCLPLDRVRDYFLNVMQYDLGPAHLKALEQFHRKCVAHGLIGAAGSRADGGTHVCLP